MQTNFCDRGWTDENNMFPQEEEGGSLWEVIIKTKQTHNLTFWF